MKRFFDRTFWLYLGLGLVNYAFCNAVMLLLHDRLELSESTVLLIEFLMQTGNSFLLNRYVTFRAHRVSRFWLLYSLLTVGVCYVLAKVLLRELFDALLQLPAFMTFAAAVHRALRLRSDTAVLQKKLVLLLCTLSYSVINYFGQRYLVFRPVKEDSV